MLSVIMLIVIILSVIILNVVLLNVGAPWKVFIICVDKKYIKLENKLKEKS